MLLDRDMKWTVEPGAYDVMLGASSEDIRVRGEFRVR
jgi:beta-glucosidase